MVTTAITQRRPASLPGRGDGGRELSVYVLFTGVHATLDAVHEAAALARELGASISLVYTARVPWPLPLDEPPVNLDFMRRRFHALADDCAVELRFEIVVCRDTVPALNMTLPRPSLILIGGPRRWWPTRERRLGRALERAGHHVIFVNSKKEHSHA